MVVSFWPSPSSSSPSAASDDSVESDIRELVDQKVTRKVITLLVDRVAEAVDFGLNRPSTSNSNSRPAWRQSERDEFTTFVTNVLRKAEVQMNVILGALVYIDRAMPHLRIAITDWAHHRVFLGALILAHKYLNDSCLKNVHWAICTGVFGRRDVGRIEREFLDVLDFQLGVSEADLLAHHAAVMALHSNTRRFPSFSAARHLKHANLRRSPEQQHHHVAAEAPVPRLTRVDTSPASPDSSDSSSPCTPPPVHPFTSASTASSPYAVSPASASHRPMQGGPQRAASKLLETYPSLPDSESELAYRELDTKSKCPERALPLPPPPIIITESRPTSAEGSLFPHYLPPPPYKSLPPSSSHCAPPHAMDLLGFHGTTTLVL